jgi:hypothetical protein
MMVWLLSLINSISPKEEELNSIRTVGEDCAILPTSYLHGLLDGYGMHG